MKKIYIAGPYTSHAEDGHRQYQEIDEHIRAAEDVAIRLADMGVGFLCPHTHTAHFEVKASAPESFYIEMDMDMLKMCDAIVMVRGWERSSGSKAEHLYAIEHNMPRFYEGEWEMIREWYDEQTLLAESGSSEEIPESRSKH